MIWNESIECMDRESLRKIQSIRLKKIVEHVYHNTPFYRKKMQELGITPDDINSIDDIVKLPFTTKYDLRDNYPFGLCAVPMSQIVRIHASSGTTGKPTVVGYTRKDLSSWAECLSRAFTAYGADSSDFFHVAYGYGLFTGGLGSAAHTGIASSSEGYFAARSSSEIPWRAAQRREPSMVICWGVRIPATTSSPWALMRYSPLNMFSPVAASRENATPVAELLPMLP